AGGPGRLRRRAPGRRARAGHRRAPRSRARAGRPPLASLPAPRLTTGVLIGLGLSAAAGLNAWAVLLLFHGLYLVVPQEFGGPTVAFLSSDAVLTAALVLFLAEFVADKIPIVDHVWNLVQTILRPIVGALLALSVVSDPSPAARAGLAAAGAAA